MRCTHVRLQFSSYQRSSGNVEHVGRKSEDNKQTFQFPFFRSALNQNPLAFYWSRSATSRFVNNRHSTRLLSRSTEAVRTLQPVPKKTIGLRKGQHKLLPWYENITVSFCFKSLSYISLHVMVVTTRRCCFFFLLFFNLFFSPCHYANIKYMTF